VNWKRRAIVGGVVAFYLFAIVWSRLSPLPFTNFAGDALAAVQAAVWPLLGVWLAMSRRTFGVRLISVTVLTIFLLVFTLICWNIEPSYVLTSVGRLAATTAPLMYARRQGLMLVTVEDAEALVLPRLQFSLRHILCCMTIAAILFAMPQVLGWEHVRRLLFHDQAIFVGASNIFSASTIVIIAFVCALGLTHCWWVAAPLCVILYGAYEASLFLGLVGTPFEWNFLALGSWFSLIIALTAMAFRLAGYRLMLRPRGESEKLTADRGAKEPATWAENGASGAQ
jgi:hypothetical protein